jgi:elongation factor P
MKVNAISIRAGNVLEHEGKLWVVLKSQTIQPGKGAAVVQVEMRDILSGTKKDERFRTQETVERARLDEEEMQFLFDEGDLLTFMNTESFEQIQIGRDLVGEPAQFLQEGMVCTVTLHEGRPMGVQLPPTVTMEITEAEPVVKGQTASSSYKPAILENGSKVMVPPHIETGTRVVVNTIDGTYAERAKD